MLTIGLLLDYRVWQLILFHTKSKFYNSVDLVSVYTVDMSMILK